MAQSGLEFLKAMIAGACRSRRWRKRWASG
jgi:hypothetical protein